jgi:hypothetical protein
MMCLSIRAQADELEPGAEKDVLLRKHRKPMSHPKLRLVPVHPGFSGQNELDDCRR